MLGRDILHGFGGWGVFIRSKIQYWKVYRERWEKERWKTERKGEREREIEREREREREIDREREGGQERGPIINIFTG